MRESPPSDPAEHALQFAREWADRLERYVEGRMHALDVPEDRIGASDHERGVPWRTFFPDEVHGGGVSAGGRIDVDSGVLNPGLLDPHYGPEAGAIWAGARLRDRIDAIIVHELAEGLSGSHQEALATAAGTARPISEAARAILRVMDEGSRRDRP